eukprot:m.245055 g.245055  ORF g.245055 m.245055 type:complete len:521 (-) comp14592_c0_seq1:83-1645(-)
MSPSPLINFWRDKMQRVGRRILAPRRNKALAWGQEEAVARDDSRYPFRLQFYNTPPDDTVTLEEFEQYAVDRLKVLKTIELLKIRFPKRGSEFDTKMRAITRQYLPLSARGEQDNDAWYMERRKDHISHFVLRLAFCRSEDLRRWLLQYEAELFRFRLETEAAEDCVAFLAENKLSYELVGMEEKMAHKQALSALGRLGADIESTDYYKVPFEDALELVRSRRTFLSEGVAYVAREDMFSITVGVFRSRLSSHLTTTSKALPELEEDDRLMPLLKALGKQNIGGDFGKRSDSDAKVCVADLPKLSTESFPLCMRDLYEDLTTTHHLKHTGRMQFGLFLKGIGLTLEDAILFWRTEMTKGQTTPDKFDKAYAYNIRHNYGKEGKRTDYTPYSCVKIITGNPPNTVEHHGCPFKHSDRDSLRLRLNRLQVPTVVITEILSLVADQKFQIACTRYFEATHKTTNTDLMLQHPNQYFLESRKLLTGEKPTAGPAKAGGAGEAVKEEIPDEELLAAAAMMDDDMD